MDSILYSLYLAAVTHAYQGPAASTSAAPTPRRQARFQAAASCPVSEATPGAEIAWELLNDGCGVGFNKWSTVTITAPEE